MAAKSSLTWTDWRLTVEEEVCPVKEKSLWADRGTSIYIQDSNSLIQSSYEEEDKEERRTSVSVFRRMGEEEVSTQVTESSDDELGRLDIDLDRKSKQHNLTSRNVRAILHEVITHERVVAMMKAAIRDTQDLPKFEPKMTRSRLKQAFLHGQPLYWSLSRNTTKHPQFVDIDLEDNEDSSDEEYCPAKEDEEEEDMVEETFLSDADSLESPPRMNQGSAPNLPTEPSLQKSPGLHWEQEKTSTCSPQLIPTALEPSFLDRLNAVEEELDCSPAYTYNQAEGGAEEDCLAYRTRSRHPLVNVPLGKLEAKLLAPDITADMYDQRVGQREEDRHWTGWLQSLMALDSEEEGDDDDDDPEYNFLDDLDEPDLEDYRTDRAVQITKREVNELLEELFDTLQEEEEAVVEEEEVTPPMVGPKFNVPQALRFEPPLAGMLTERRQTVRREYEALQQKRALQDTTNHPHTVMKGLPCPPPNTLTPLLMLPGQVCPSLHLDNAQKLQLQQQIQQHVQLLTQVQLLSRSVGALSHEACITKQYLEELQTFAHRREAMFLPSSFRVCNLQGALDLLQEVEQSEKPSPAPAPSRRLLPRMSPATNSHAFPLLPSDTAWLFATRPVFLYPELLPVCSLDPALHSQHQRSVYTAGEDGLIVLGLKHFEGTVQSDQLISSYLLCKNRWNFMKHMREMSSQRAPPNNVIKVFLTHGVVPPLPLACSRVQPGDQRPPVDRNNSNMPNWLKNSRQIIQKTRLDSDTYPPSLPPGCTLRLHPYWLNKSRPPVPRNKRFFMLAHNASLLPLAKAPADRDVDRQIQPISCLSQTPPDVELFFKPSSLSGGLPPSTPQITETFPLTATPPVSTRCLRIGPTITRQQLSPHPLVSPPSDTTNPIMSLAPATVKPGCFFLQMVWTPPTAKSQYVLGQEQNKSVREDQTERSQDSVSPKLIEVTREDTEEDQSLASASTLSPLSLTEVREEVLWNEKGQVSEEEVERKNRTVLGLVSLNGGENTGGGGEDREAEGGAGGGGREQDESREGEGEQGGEGEEEEAREREEGGGEREENGEKDEDQDRQGEEEEEEDFDDLTQDEDEEEVMSSASEESVLSVPELQETMKQLTWLAAERRICADGDSEEDHSPTSEEEEEEGGPKEEGPGKGRTSKGGEDEEMQSGEGTVQIEGRCPGRGRGRSRPLRGLRRSRQERHSKDAAKLLLLFDEKLLENDPHRECKDMAFAKGYLSRVCEALQDAPGQVEEFVSLLSEFEHVEEGQDVVLLFRKLRCILGDRTDLVRDFAAFLHPEQALQCGMFEEQQAFERSRRFLRQLEISFGDNPSQYQKIIKALQSSPDLSPNGISELKTQMATLLKGHAHLQAEFWVFFDELRPPQARPGQFEDANWPEEGGGSDGGEGSNQVSAGGASSSFEEVTLPELDEEDEGHKIQPMASRRRRRKIDPHRNYKSCDWSHKDWTCSCHDAKIRRHRRKGCSHCHDSKSAGAVSAAMKSLDPLYSQISSSHIDTGDKDLDLKGDDDSPQPDPSSASWEGPFPLTEEEEELCEEEDDEDEEERKSSEKEHHLAIKRIRREEMLLQPAVPPSCSSVTSSSVRSSIFTSGSSSLFTSSSAAPQPSPPPDLPVCAKNISLTASGQKVILWTREADRVILTTCQQDGANPSTFQAISNLLGNKTSSEVSRRFRDLMCLFRTAARQTSSEDEAPSTEAAGASQDED